MVSQEPAMVAHMNTSLELKDFSLSASYSGHMGTQRVKDGDHFHMFDLYAHYSLNKEMGISIGYELAYTDNIQSKDAIGHGVFAMASYSKKAVSSLFIFFADPKIENRYYIGSLNGELMKNLSLYILGGYTNTKSTPWYGLVGLRYSKDNFFAGTYWVFDKENPGPLCGVGVTF